MTSRDRNDTGSSSARRRLDYLPARSIPTDGESLMSFVARTATCNDTTIAAILGRNQVARTSPDYRSVLQNLADLTRQPLSRITAMTMDGCHRQVLAREGWSAARWGQHCPCAPRGVQRRDWALTLAPICFHCGHLIRMPSIDVAQPIRAPNRIVAECAEVLTAAHRSATDPRARARLDVLRADVPWIVRRISRSWLRTCTSDDEHLIHARAVADLESTGEAEDPGVQLPRSPAIRALTIAAAWAAQRPWSSAHTPPHPRPALDRRADPGIGDAQVFTRRILRAGARNPQTLRLPSESIRHPRREDLLRLVLGHTSLTIEHIPGCYRQDNEPLCTDPTEWLWRSRIATLLGQCVLLRNRWSLAEEPIYRFTRDGNYVLFKGSWPKWLPVLILESDIAHAMNLARMLTQDGLINYRERRDTLRHLTSVPAEVADELPRAARGFEDHRRLAAAWIWCDATGDSPRTTQTSRELAFFDAALNPEGRLTLRSHATALCNVDSDLFHATQRGSATDTASNQITFPRPASC